MKVDETKKKDHFVKVLEAPWKASSQIIHPLLYGEVFALFQRHMFHKSETA